jgi:hypothetical protein
MPSYCWGILAKSKSASSPNVTSYNMRTLVIVAFGLSLILLAVSEVSAAHRPNKRYVRHARPNINREPRHPYASDWYPRDSSKLPFGSARWWDQMRRERSGKN